MYSGIDGRSPLPPGPYRLVIGSVREALPGFDTRQVEVKPVIAFLDVAGQGALAAVLGGDDLDGLVRQRIRAEGHGVRHFPARLAEALDLDTVLAHDHPGFAGDVVLPVLDLGTRAGPRGPLDGVEIDHPPFQRLLVNEDLARDRRAVEPPGAAQATQERQGEVQTRRPSHDDGLSIGVPRDHLAPGNGDQRLPGGDVDALAHEMHRGVAEHDIDPPRVPAARRRRVVGAGIAVDARKVDGRLVVAPAYVDEVRGGGVGAELGVDVAVAGLVSPQEAALVVALAQRAEVLADDHGVAGAVGHVLNAGAVVDAERAAP